eukprot:UN00943
MNPAQHSTYQRGEYPTNQPTHVSSAESGYLGDDLSLNDDIWVQQYSESGHNITLQELHQHVASVGKFCITLSDLPMCHRLFAGIVMVIMFVILKVGIFFGIIQQPQQQSQCQQPPTNNIQEITSQDELCKNKTEFSLKSKTFILEKDTNYMHYRQRCSSMQSNADNEAAMGASFFEERGDDEQIVAQSETNDCQN